MAWGVGMGQASLSITTSWSLLKLMSIQSVMSKNLSRASGELEVPRALAYLVRV